MTRHRSLHAAALLAAAALLLACGDDSKSDTTSNTTDLAFTIGTDAEPSIATATLVVSEDGVVTGTGYLAAPDAAAAAAELLQNASAVTRLTAGEPVDQICTEIYGGPDVGVVTGTYHGKTVDTRFHRSNGCGISDWQLFEAMLGRPRWSADRRIYFRDETAITVTVGTEFLIELASNATTGYAWEPKLDTEAALEVVERQYLAPDTSLIGAGGYEQFTLIANAAGTTTLVFEYARSFEPGNPPADAVTFTVTSAG